MRKVTHELNHLRLADLSDEWVEAIYYAEFLEFGEVPAEYALILENLEIRSVFRKIMASVDSWLKDPNVEKSWAVLSREVNPRKLLAVLAYYIDSGSKSIMSHEHRNTAMLAARVYFKLLSIPGYKAYHIYHSQLFAQSLACLSYPKVLCENEDRYFNLKQLTREVNSVIKEVALFVQALRAVIVALQLNPADMNFEDILSNLVEFTGGAIVNKLDIDKIELAHVSKIIYDMIDILLSNLGGGPNTEAIQLLFKCLLPKLVAASVDNKTANNIVRASYVTYSGLVLTKYGNAALSGFVTLLQHLCYTCDGLERAEVRSARVSLIIGLMSLLPGSSYRFIVRWILKLSNTAKVAHRHIALELIALLLNNDPEESFEPAEREAPAIMDNQASIESSNKPAICYAPAAKTSCDPPSENQNTATGSVLTDGTSAPSIQNAPETGSLMDCDEPTPGPSGIQKVPKAMNCDDATAGPSGIKNDKDSQSTDSAVAGPGNPGILADSGIQDPTVGFDSECDDYIMSLLNNGQDLPELPGPIPELGDIDLQFAMFNEINTQGTNEEANPTAGAPDPAEGNQDQAVTAATPKTAKKSKKSKASPNLEPPALEPLPMDDDNSQDPDPDVASEDDIAGLLRQRPHVVSHAELLRAVYERVSDVSSTLRTRALALLTDCLASSRAPLRAAVAELNGPGPVSRLMVVAARCVSDERAAVRKAAVALVQRELGAGPPPQPNDLGILVSLCRDASILVRSAAIAALGELVTKRPSDAVFDAFLSGPMHQMSDPETKVQEQVVTLIQQVAIDRLQVYSSVGNESPLPWQFLAAITRHNMRRHLQKACTLLAKTSKCINHRVVDVVSTHLGAGGDARDLQCLVLLTSVARIVDYSDVTFILDYYYALADNVQGRDQRLMPLSLELLTLWSRYLAPAARTALRDHLAARLATAAGDDGQYYTLYTLEGGATELWSRYLAPAARTALRDHLAARLATAAGDDGQYYTLYTLEGGATELWSRYLAPAARTALRDHLAARLATAAGDDGQYYTLYTLEGGATELWSRYLAPAARTALRDHLAARLATAAGDDGQYYTLYTLEGGATELWSRYLAPAARTALRDHLAARLATAAGDDGQYYTLYTLEGGATELWSRYLAPAARTALRDHLAARLATAAGDDGQYYTLYTLEGGATELWSRYLAPAARTALRDHLAARLATAAGDDGQYYTLYTLEGGATELWSRYLAPAARTALRDHLAARLATAAGDDGQYYTLYTLEGGATELWSRYLAPAARTALRDHLAARLATAAGDDGQYYTLYTLEGGATELWSRYLAPAARTALRDHLAARLATAAGDDGQYYTLYTLEGGATELWSRYLAPAARTALRDHLAARLATAAGDDGQYYTLYTLEGGATELWSRYLAPAARTALRDHLAARLATAAGDDGCRIPCATLAAHLDPTNLQWANELLQLSEKRALNGGGVSEWVRAADLSLVAPAPPSPALLSLFLSALQAPPAEWSAACHGAAVAGAGRLCVRSRGAAAAAAPALAAILHEPSRALQARVNALLALADICVRYTCIVEPLLGSVSLCLSTGSPAALRRSAARSLTRLLLAGYLRLRPPLYYRYCALLADSDNDVREPAEYYLTSCLTPDAIYHHFVDCIKHYNSPLSESISFDARQLIYDVMLQRLSLVQKLNVQCRLAREVLEHAAEWVEEHGEKREHDGQPLFEPAMAAALLDSITLLCGPRMKLPKKPDKTGDVADIDDLQERVTTNIVSHKMKRTVAEVLVPAVLRLHARVQLGGGQVAAYLVRIANDLLIDYRQEIEELIENDEVLVERMKVFQENIGLETPFGNTRNLVTTSAPPEPDTPRAPRRRAPRAAGPPRKRALRI